jgi:hypothetical protein
MSPQFSARLFAGLMGVVSVFQLALALGAPWGDLAMGGAFPGVYPPGLRVAAFLQIAVLAGIALVVLSRVNLALPAWHATSRWLIWVIVALAAIGVLLNLITPSATERLIWGPVTIVLFITALRTATSP